jgi:hypothetical protein
MKMNRKTYLIIGGIVAVVAVVSVVLSTVLGSHGPVIASLEAYPAGASPGGTCQIVCDARASDGGELSYDWQATGGTLDGTGATVTWTAPVTGASHNISVTVVDGHGLKATSQVTIQVRENHAPYITSLTASKDWTTPSDSIEVTCIASDADDDVLSYEWTASGGDISGSGAVVNWTAPEEIGAYDIWVKVKDGWGGEAAAELSLSANSGIPPTVEKLIITPVNNIYLRNSAVPGCNFDVYKNKHYAIECIASNTSGELSYQWSSTDGEISGEGPLITWISPDKLSVGSAYVNVTVMVNVSDGVGNSVVKSVVFHMASCTCGSWPLESGEILF